jgi:hypothetical protein
MSGLAGARGPLAGGDQAAPDRVVVSIDEKTVAVTDNLSTRGTENVRK